MKGWKGKGKAQRCSCNNSRKTDIQTDSVFNMLEARPNADPAIKLDN